MSDLPPATAATGRFQTVNGQVLDPGGKVFTARGINISPSQMDAANQVLALFPGLNFVRVTVIDYQSPDTYAAFVNTMTSHGIVVEFEDHTSSDGAAGGVPQIRAVAAALGAGLLLLSTPVSGRAAATARLGPTGTLRGPHRACRP